MIEKHPENNELLQAYVKLIEKKTEFSIAWEKNRLESDKSSYNYRLEYNKNITEINKALLDKSPYTYLYHYWFPIS